MPTLAASPPRQSTSAPPCASRALRALRLRRELAPPVRALFLAALLALALSACSSAPHGHDRDGKLRRVPPDFTGHMQVWWSDERLREEGDYRQGRRDGHVLGYHPDGSLQFEGDFQDGVPTGRLDQHYAGGALAIRETLSAGTPQGPRTEFFPDGSLASTVQIVDGKPDGERLDWHPGGLLARRARYEHGVPVGHWEQFDGHGRLTADTWYWTADGASAGYLETVHDSEGRISVQTRMLLQEETWLGRVTVWYPNGEEAGLVETVNGQRHGRDIAWDATGRKRSEGRRVDDLREGRWTFWDERGFVERSVDYVADKPVEEHPAVAP